MQHNLNKNQLADIIDILRSQEGSEGVRTVLPLLLLEGTNEELRRMLVEQFDGDPRFEILFRCMSQREHEGPSAEQTARDIYELHGESLSVPVVLSLLGRVVKPGDDLELSKTRSACSIAYQGVSVKARNLFDAVRHMFPARR